MLELALLFLVGTPQWMAGYSMLTHEEIVDLAWADQIQPLLRQRFPAATDDDLNQAHAYAYRSCIIQDLGYYPFGNKDFSNLLHYVRSGDFVVAMMRSSQDLNEYAFALGALAHYTSDTEGHPSINRAVAIDYPKLRREFGNEVTYEDDHRAHIRTEFGFDVVQVAKGRFTSGSYHNFISFQVSKPLLERAFRETYGLELKDVLSNPDLSIGSYRRSVSTIIPEMTRVALLTKHAPTGAREPRFRPTQISVSALPCRVRKRVGDTVSEARMEDQTSRILRENPAQDRTAEDGRHHVTFADYRRSLHQERQRNC